MKKFKLLLLALTLLIGGNVFASSSQEVFVEDPNWTSTSSSKPVMTIENKNADAAGSSFVLKKDSLTPADNDVVGSIKMQGKDSTGAFTDGSEIKTIITDITDGSEDSKVVISTYKAGTKTEALVIDGSAISLDAISVSTISANSSAGILIGDDGSSYSIKVEDGGNVGINKLNPETALDVEGTVSASALNVNGTSSLGGAVTDVTDLDMSGDLTLTGGGIVQASGTNGQVTIAGNTGATTSGAGVIVDNLITKTQGNLLDIRNNSASVFTVEWNGDTDIDGDLTVSTSVLVVNADANTISVGGGLSVAGDVIIANTKGIDFSATGDGAGTATSEKLVDYEEGTWSAVVSDASTGGNVASGTTLRADYVKVGTQVTVWFGLNNMDFSGMTTGNALYIQGLPYPNKTTTTTETLSSTLRLTNATYTGEPFMNLDSAVSYLYLRENKTGINPANIIIDDLASGASDLAFSITYKTP